MDKSKTDWNDVADRIENCDNAWTNAHEQAITLCRRMAKGELVERSELDQAKQNVRDKFIRGEIAFVPTQPAPTEDERNLLSPTTLDGPFPNEREPTASTSYRHATRCVEGGEWLGPYGKCKTNHTEERERERARANVQALLEQGGGTIHPMAAIIVLLSERAAADKAGFERGLKEGYHNMLQARRLIRCAKSNEADDVLTHALNQPGYRAPEVEK